MVYKRKRSNRSKMKRRRFNMRRRKMSIPRPLTNKVVSKRTFYNGSWSWGTAATDQFWRYRTFQFGNLPSYQEITALFDEWKINAIKVTYRPRYDSISTNSVTDGISVPVITQPQAYAHVCVDPTSQLVPAGTYGTSSLNYLFENNNVKTYTLNKPFSVYLKPKCRDFVFGGGNTSKIIPATYMRDTSVQHYGFHIYLQQNNFSTGANYVILDEYITFYFSARSLR